MNLNVIIYGVLAGAATLAGIAAIIYQEKLARKYSIFLISFAAGIILGTTFLNLIPEAIELNKNYPFFILAGFLIFYLVENFIAVHACREEQCEKHRITVISITGLAMHSLIDGIAIGVGFEISNALGVLTSLAVISHEFPEGLVAVSLMLYSGYKKSKAIFYSIVVALATPLGAILSLLFLKDLKTESLGIILSFVAGTFLYVGAADLIPETHKEKNKTNWLFVFIGIFVIYLASKLF